MGDVKGSWGWGALEVTPTPGLGRWSSWQRAPCGAPKGVSAAGLQGGPKTSWEVVAAQVLVVRSPTSIRGPASTWTTAMSLQTWRPAQANSAWPSQRPPCLSLVFWFPRRLHSISGGEAHLVYTGESSKG